MGAQEGACHGDKAVSSDKWEGEMTEAKLKKKLDELRALPAETEWMEFKEAMRSL